MITHSGENLIIIFKKQSHFNLKAAPQNLVPGNFMNTDSNHQYLSKCLISICMDIWGHFMKHYALDLQFVGVSDVLNVQKWNYSCVDENPMLRDQLTWKLYFSFFFCCLWQQTRKGWLIAGSGYFHPEKWYGTPMLTAPPKLMKATPSFFKNIKMPCSSSPPLPPCRWHPCWPRGLLL